MAMQVHHVVHARAMALALTRVPVDAAVGSLVRLATARDDVLRRALALTEETEWRDHEARERAAALLELALHDVGAGLRATA